MNHLENNQPPHPFGAPLHRRGIFNPPKHTNGVKNINMSKKFPSRGGVAGNA
jgi:hypothetical protein